METRPFLTALALAAGTASPLLAGDNVTDSFSTTRSSQSQEEIEDLGVIAPAGGVADFRSKFRASVGIRTDYTSNAKLSGNHGSGDVLYLPTVEVGFKTPLGHGFGLDIAAKVESALYSRFDERAFIGYSLPTTLEWRPRPALPRLYIGAEPYRFDSFDTGDLLTQAVGLSVGTDWGYSFNAGNSLAFLGYSFTEYIADPSIDDRSAHRAIAGLAHQIRPQLFGQALYTYQYSDYDIDRRDSRHVFALSLIYQFNRQLFGSLGGTFIDSDSTQRRASYQSAVASLGLTWNF